MRPRFHIAVLIIDIFGTFFAIMFLALITSLITTPQIVKVVHKTHQETTRRPSGFKVLSVYTPLTPNYWCHPNLVEFNKIAPKEYFAIVLSDSIFFHRPNVGAVEKIAPTQPDYKERINAYLTEINDRGDGTKFMFLLGSFKLYYDVRDPLQTAPNIRWCEEPLLPERMQGLSEQFPSGIFTEAARELRQLETSPSVREASGDINDMPTPNSGPKPVDESDNSPSPQPQSATEPSPDTPWNPLALPLLCLISILLLVMNVRHRYKEFVS